MPRQLKCCDWRYRVFFDTKLREEVLRFIDKLKPNEAVLYHELLDFHTHYYSPLQLSDALNDERLDNSEVLALANSKVNGLLFTPSSVQFDVHPDAQEFKDTAKHGIDASFHYRRVIGHMFGHWLNSMKEIVYNGAKEQDVAHGNSVVLFGANEIDALCYAQSEYNWTKSIFGDSKAPTEYLIDIDNSDGYGEWVDKGLSGEEFDRLVLHVNSESSYSEDVKHTLLHEVYPGHGHFYNSISRDNKLFDYGALELIEGWATFAEWNAKIGPYSSAIRSNSLCFMRDFFDTNMQGRVVEVYLRGERIGASKYFLNTLLRDMTQYIGYREAFYLGALFFECCGVSPKTAIGELDNRNCGSFFSTWETMRGYK